MHKADKNCTSYIILQDLNNLLIIIDMRKVIHAKNFSLIYYDLISQSHKIKTFP